jgi:hypothetical protein
MGHNNNVLPSPFHSRGGRLINRGIAMRCSRKFKKLLKKYLEIKGLDIIIYLHNGRIIELDKSRTLVKNEIVVIGKNNKKVRIPLSKIKSVDLYAA